MTEERDPEESVPGDDVGSSLLARLVADCLDRVADEGPGAVEAFCQEHAEHAEAIQRRIQALQQMGLLEVRDPDQSEFPEQLGPFRLIRRLGAGGMGVVYLAEQIPLGRTVALKLMRPDQVFFQGSRERFQREVMAVARLHHPGIVSVHTAGEEGGIPFFAMEYIRGCSLVEALQGLRPRQPQDLSAALLVRAVRECSPPEDDATEAVEPADATWTEVCLRLVLQVAEALAHAHQKGIHHRDIKPSNIMIHQSGHALLLDFGLASASGTSRLTKSGSQLGSLPYMAPESLEGGPAEDGARADVYSLGVTLYEMLTLHCPFQDENPSVTIRKVLQGEPDSMRLRHPAVSWAAETVCLKAMERDPARRYATAEEFARDLGNALEHRPILARRPGAMLRVQRWCRRHPARAVSWVAAVLLLASSVTWGLVQRSTNRQLTQTSTEKDLALEELRERNEELDAALKEVDKSFGQVVDAGIRMLSRVGFDILQNVPLTDTVRRQLLDEAHALSLELQRDEPDDPRLRFEMARTLRLLGSFQGDMGDHQKGDTQLRQAADMYQRLLAEQPDHLDAHEQLVRTWHALGASLMQRHLYADAAEAFEAGGAAGSQVLDRLAAEEPTDVTWAKFRTVTALNLQGAGTAWRFLARMEDADRAYEDARGLLSQMTQQYHEDQQETLAVCCINHSAVLRALGRTDEAVAAVRAGIGELQDMVEREPGNAGNRASLGTALLMLESILPREDPETIPVAAQAVEELRTARRHSPGSAVAVRNLASALESLGGAYKNHGNFEEARVHLNESIELVRGLVRGRVAGAAETLSVALIKLAEVQAEEGEQLEAEETFREALELADPWIDDPDTDLTTRSHSVVVLEAFARFLREEELLEDALPLSQRALQESRRQVVTRPHDPLMAAQLSTSGLLTSEILLELFDHNTAHEVLASLVDATLNDEERWQGAVQISSCLELLAEDPDLEAADLEARTGEYVATAVALLDGLEDKVRLTDPADLDREGYEALADQAGFTEWLSRQ